ncbi:MAG: response regulator [Candidatus Aenigmarchaeota archaeon]|nr:response regulator [Candidatus Aenigmarchaeota archaeon]
MTKKIIIADDQSFFRDSIVLLVQGEYPTLEIETVDDGKPLVEKVRNGGYSFVLTDNNMPVIKGTEAVRQIRQYDENTPIYLMSSSNDPDTVRGALKAGATDFIYKNKLWEELQPVLKKHLG